VENKTGVPGICFTDSLKLADKIPVVGHHANLTRRVAPIGGGSQLDGVDEAGDNAAIRVLDRVHERDKVCRIVEDMAVHVPA